MKAGIVGPGAVGAATAMAIVLRARVRELVPVITLSGSDPRRRVESAVDEPARRSRRAAHVGRPEDVLFQSP